MQLSQLNLQKHPDFDATIEEIINKDYDEVLMAKAINLTSSESQAEAMYVVLKLKNKALGG